MTDEPKPYSLRVEHGKIREFAVATGSRSSAFTEEPSPFVPPTFLTISAHWMTKDNLALADRDLRRILHGEQEYVFHGPPPVAGDVLVGQQRIESEYQKQGRRGGQMRFIVVVTEFRDSQGKLVCEGRSTIIETGAPE